MEDWNELKELKDIDFYINTILYQNPKMLDLKKFISRSEREDIDFNLGQGTIIDTINMLRYVGRGTKDCCTKAYVLQSILDKVLGMYFDTLKEVEKAKEHKEDEYVIKFFDDLLINNNIDEELRLKVEKYLLKNILGVK